MGKNRENSKPKRNIPLRVAMVLFCLTLWTTHLVSGLYARYSTSSQTGDQARVAKFAIRGEEALSQSIVEAINPGDPQTVSIVINNESEVAVEYTITVTNVTGNLPLELSMEKEDGVPELVPNGNTYTAQQLPGDHHDNYTLKIEWPAGGAKEDLDRMGMVDHITVTVTATQVD